MTSIGHHEAIGVRELLWQGRRTKAMPAATGVTFIPFKVADDIMKDIEDELGIGESMSVTNEDIHRARFWCRARAASPLRDPR